MALGFLSNFIRDLPMYLLSLPVLLMAFSVHESAHGYAAYKLGDPTARNLGRITLNPVKHIDIFGFICMLIAHVGWAKPVPINARHFRNPRRDMAITGAAGPISNLILAILHLIVLRVVMLLMPKGFLSEAAAFTMAYMSQEAFIGTLGFTLMSLVVYLLYLGVVLNVCLAIFNLIPVPPFDGSRIFYAFLPPKWYFGVMKYERIIMMVILVLLIFGFLDGPLAFIQNGILNALFTVVGMGGKSADHGIMNCMLVYVDEILHNLF
jgi:Zn-dependent protease